MGRSTAHRDAVAAVFTLGLAVLPAAAAADQVTPSCRGNGGCDPVRGPVVVVSNPDPPRLLSAAGLRVEAGIHAGVGISLTRLDPGPYAGVALGLRRSLGPVDGFIRIRATYESHAMHGTGDLACTSLPPDRPCLAPDVAHYEFELVEREVQATLAIGYRLRALHPRWTPYGGVSASYARQFVQSTVFGFTQSEQRNSFAIGAIVGLEYEFAVFAPFLEVTARYAPINALETGPSQVSTLQIGCGVRFVL